MGHADRPRQRSRAQSVRSIQSFDSNYDAGRATTADDQDFANFTAQEIQGKRRFLLYRLVFDVPGS